jgi:hypothetical protein
VGPQDVLLLFKAFRNPKWPRRFLIGGDIFKNKKKYTSCDVCRLSRNVSLMGSEEVLLFQVGAIRNTK